MNPLDKRRCVERYTSRHREFGYDPRALGWGKNGRQHVRFAALCGVSPERRGSVLDVGCGFGDLYGYLKGAGWEGRYVGVDIVPTLLDEARRQYPGADVRLCDILHEEVGEEFDYVVSSGIFNARLRDEPQEGYIAAMLRRMLGLSRSGVAADFLSTRVDFQREEAYHASPAGTLELGMGLSRRAVLRHDYLPYEFCIYLYRQSAVTGESRYAADL